MSEGNYYKSTKNFNRAYTKIKNTNKQKIKHITRFQLGISRVRKIFVLDQMLKKITYIYGLFQ